MADLQEAEDSAKAELRNVAIGAVVLYLCKWACLVVLFS